MKVEEKMSKLVKIDEARFLVSKGHFAHMCMEINLEKPLIFKFQLKRKVKKIYKDIHLVCFSCIIVIDSCKDGLKTYNVLNIQSFVKNSNL